jgi:hypothetical protein
MNPSPSIRWRRKQYGTAGAHPPQDEVTLPGAETRACGSGRPTRTVGSRGIASAP